MTTEYEKLAAPFAVVHHKPGGNMTYITGEQVITRLNEELGWDSWTFLVREHGYDADIDEFWALGELTVIREERVITKQQFGSQKPNRYSGGPNQGKVIDLGFDLKGAATDALKKCASLIGVGLYLYEKDGGMPTPQQQPRNTASHQARPSLWTVTRGMGYADDEVRALSQQMFENKEPKQLNADQIRRLVLELENKKKAVASA